MNEETAKQASELLKNKSLLIDDLSKLQYKNNTGLRLGYVHNTAYSDFSIFPLNISNYTDTVLKVRDILIEEINKKIEEVDIQLKELK